MVLVCTVRVVELRMSVSIARNDRCFQADRFGSCSGLSVANSREVRASGSNSQT